MSEWTIKRLLEWITDYLSQKGVDSPRLATELLLSYALDMKRIELYTRFDQQVPKPDLDRLHKLVKRAGEHEPIQYIVGRTEFYSLEILVCRDCLIPRPETEQLVERAIDFLRGRVGEQKVLELCTGSGCISTAIAKNHSNCSIVATDICEEALSTAEKNIEKHDLTDRVKLLKGDLYEPLIPEFEGEQFDLIVSNPPYVSDEEYENLDKNVRDFEPSKALKSGEQGLDVLRPLIQGAPTYLKGSGGILLEVGYRQGGLVRGILAENKFENVKIYKDFGNLDRIISAENSS